MKLIFLTECIGLVTYEISDVKAKNMHSGAAKVVEIVAEKRPELVADHLEELIPALSVRGITTTLDDYSNNGVLRTFE